MSAERVDSCRSCGSAPLVPFLDLGSTPVANALLSGPDEPAPVYPLEVGFCPDCTLVQLLHVLPAEHIFDADYPYFSSFSDSLDEHSRLHVRDLVGSRGIGRDSFVLEVASNDGYLLRHLLPLGVRVLGIEPTPGPAAAARGIGVPTVQEFLGPEVAERLRREHGPADVVLANNVMAHVPDLRGFVASLALLMADDGILQVENPGVGWLIENVEFDTIYHEHYRYFSTLAVDRLMASEGLHLNDVECFPSLQGGTLRWTCSRTPGRTARAEEQLARERAQGLDDEKTYRALGEQVLTLQHDLRALLTELTADGRSLAAYGAAAKGATLLNSTGIDRSLVDFVVDRNPHKQGKWIPGAAIPVLAPEALLDRQPDHVLLLAWNYADEVRRQQAEYERRGGRFIVPVPTPRILPPSVEEVRLEDRDVEVVLVAYRSRPMVEQLLRGLPERLPVVVVDNSDDVDGLSQVIAARPRGRYLRGGGIGYARAANLGARTSGAEFLVFVNPDTRPTEEHLTALLDDVAADDRCSGVGATVVDADGRPILGIGGWEPTFPRALAHAAGLHKVFPRAGVYARPEVGRPVQLDWVSGTCMAVRREVFLDLGGFDEDFYLYCDDVAYGRASRERGLRPRLRTDIAVPGDSGASGAPPLEMMRLRGAAMSRYVFRHRAGPHAAAIAACYVAGYAARGLQQTLRGNRRRAREHWAYAMGALSGRGTVAGRVVISR